MIIAAELLLWISVVSFFPVAIYLLIADRTGSGTASAGIATVILVILNLDRIESFKGLGVEAKTRDLRKAINDAESTLTELETMSEQLRLQAESIQILQKQVDEANALAKRAQALAFMAQ